MVKLFKKLNNKKGFTLLELMVGLLIASFITIITFPIIANTKSSIKKVFIRGQYACYTNEKGQISQWLIDEKSGLVKKDTNSAQCVLEFNRKPDEIFIITAGSRENSKEQQVSTILSSNFAKSIVSNINNPKTNSAVVKTVVFDNNITSLGKSTPIEKILSSAFGTISNSHLHSNGIYDENLESCKIVYASDCYTNHKENPCQIEKDKDGKVSLNVFCDNKEPKKINLDSLVALENNFAKFNKNSRLYQTLGFTFQFTYKDSDFNPNNQISKENPSKLTKILNNIPKDRQTDLTKELLKLYSDEQAKTGGLVYILW